MDFGSMKDETECGSPQGAWVCASGADSVLSCLFIDAACAGSFPLPATARWTGNSKAPRQLRKTQRLPLLHGVCELESGERAVLHLFATKVSATVPFEHHTVLSDWRVPTHISGIVLLMGAQPDSGLAPQMRGSSRRMRDRTLDWVRAQGLPIVVAAMGLDSRTSSWDRLRQCLNLDPGVPILAGPPPARRRLAASKQSGITARVMQGTIAGLLGLSAQTFDPVYATRIVAAVSREIRGAAEDD